MLMNAEIMCVQRIKDSSQFSPHLIDMCGGLGDDHFHARLASLFERITRPDWCAAGLCHHGECAALRDVRDYVPRDFEPREPGHREMTEAFFDARYGGEDADFGDIAYDLSLRRG